ncbi:hypothetical protein [Streptomyces sp. PH10-H1]|uniref:hypothetical protein n=1 Tax=Streptomyces sp. PH10-H1 TaxID=3046212 RepID=UPI0024BB2B5C|nr:hypothetical protein [Streptomyces sp. PH10-H1]MDJ0342511.1 hypothetical protein [Streptomyces sp. PH10-H1]
MTTALEPVRSVPRRRLPSRPRRHTSVPVLEPLRLIEPSVVPVEIAAPVKVVSKRDEAAERARHLDRVCARFPTQISEANARRLAQLLGGETDGQ